MNEITKIHLGRQAFTIAVDAYKELQHYLQAIKKHMGEAGEAVDEVELRMAELLVERGVTGDKVVLPGDIDYLKKQLGEPGDFGDADTEEAIEDAMATKRLFRDTENGMLAGVCAGIGKYFGLDPAWIRLAFIALLFAGASGALLYIILWLIVPEAKTKSEHLQMQGRQVTIDAIKEVVERADVEGVARRAGNTIGKVVHGVLKVLLGVAGVSLMIVAVSVFLGLIAGSIYWALNHAVLIPYNIFPVGINEQILVYSGIAVTSIFSFFLLVAGLSMVKRKWSLPAWALGVMITLFLGGLAATGALAADAMPKISKRFEAAHQSEIQAIRPFSEITLLGEGDVDRVVEMQRRISDQYKVEVRSLGSSDASNIHITQTEDGKLEVDLRDFKGNDTCGAVCIFKNRNVQVIVSAPENEILCLSNKDIGWYASPGYSGDFGFMPADLRPCVPATQASTPQSSQYSPTDN
jgi:phage shock protein PspC (stress-responsive transcriptional regulator)